MSEKKSKGLMFKAEMVRAILAGTKTQTRRTMKVQPPASAIAVNLVDGFAYPTEGPRTWTTPEGVLASNNGVLVDHAVRCPNPVGSVIWVKETWAPRITDGEIDTRQRYVKYRATAQEPDSPCSDLDWHQWPEKWKSSMFMPRWASRISLLVTDVRVQRLHDITVEDAKAEGIRDDGAAYLDYMSGDYHFSWAVSSYQSLWESINGPGSWDANPFVWAYTFKREVPMTRGICTCNGDGVKVVCIDDICRGLGRCMHGDGEVECPCVSDPDDDDDYDYGEES